MSQSSYQSSDLDRPSPLATGTPSIESGRAWRLAWALFALGFAALVALFWDTAASAVLTWYGTATYGHCFLVIPVSAALIWARRERLAHLRPRPGWLGVVLAGLAAFLWNIGEISGTLVVQQLAFVAMSQAVFLAIMGGRVVRALAFPLLYLYFAVPFGSFLVAPLQQLTAVTIVQFLDFSGVPAHLDGFWLEIPGGTFHIAEACAGVRFLITSVALGVLAAHVLFRSWARRVLFVCLAALVPVLANGLRAYGIVLIAHLDSLAFARAVDHVTFGLVFLSLVLAILLGLGLAMREGRDVPNGELTSALLSHIGRTEVSVARMLVIGTSAMAAIIGLQALGPGGPPERAKEQLSDLAAPKIAAPWSPRQGMHQDWHPKIVGSDAEIRQRYTDDRHFVDFFVAYFFRQRQGAEVVNQQNDFAGAGPWSLVPGDTVLARQADTGIPMRTARLVSNQDERIVWYCYWVGGACTAQPIEAKLRQVKAALLGRDPRAALVVLSTPAGDSASDANVVLREFLAHLERLDGWLEQLAAQSVSDASGTSLRPGAD